MKHILTFVLLACATTTVFAQSTTVKLPTINNSSNFNITKSDDSYLLRTFGDGGFYLGGTEDSGAIPIEGAGTRLMWYPKKNAFRVGVVYGTQWNDVNIGYHSTAMGNSTTASGEVSTAMGLTTTASGFLSTAMGYSTTASGQFSTAMGASTMASGNVSTAMGYTTIASGTASTAMGNYVSTNAKGGAFVIGDNSTTSTTISSANNEMTMRFDGGYRLFTESDLSTGVTMGNGAGSWSSVSDSTKKTNFKKADGEYFLSSLSQLKLGSWNYKTQDVKQFRHYGPMAQEIFHYFGNDGVGSIGNDTTLATADMDGIIMICLQALEAEVRSQKSEIRNQRSMISNQMSEIRDQKEKNESLTQELEAVHADISTLKKEFELLKSEIAEWKAQNQSVSYSERKEQ